MPPVLGMHGLVVIILLAVPLPLLLMVDGETIDLPGMSGARLLYPLRHLDLHERVLLRNPVKPETIEGLRSYDPVPMSNAMLSVEPLDLQNRSFRHANLRNTVMVRADLRGAQLQRADLSFANLRGAVLYKTELQGAMLSGAQLQGSMLRLAVLHGAWLIDAWLQGADLEQAQLQGALLSGAGLQGANLKYAQLQGADLEGAILEGVSLEEAELQGANLSKAKLLGADLRKSQLYSKSLSLADVRMVDARGMQWQPLSQEKVKNLQTNASKWILVVPLDAIQNATKAGLEPPKITSCLRDDKTQLKCTEAYSLDKIRNILEPELEKLVCLSPYVARGIFDRYEKDSVNTDSVMTGFYTYLDKRIVQLRSKYECLGLAARTEMATVLFRYGADFERERARTVGTLPQPNKTANH